MKNTIKLFIALSVVLAVFSSCRKDSLSDESVIIDSNTEQNAFDKWIYDNLTVPYNIDLFYRLLDRESDLSYNVIPAEIEKAEKMAILVKHLCIESYCEATGSNAFIRQNFPKCLFLVGSPEYKNNGVIVLGTAEGGKVINLFNINALKHNDVASLNDSYFKTIHHEFGHILNQTRPYSNDYLAISSKYYVGDDCFDTYSSRSDSIKDGFISPYSSSEHTEDFVEMLSIFLVSDPATWESYFTLAQNYDAQAAAGTVINNRHLGAGESAYDNLSQKFEMVYNYMKDSWGIDIYELKDIIQRRQKEVPSLDFTIE